MAVLVVVSLLAIIIICVLYIRFRRNSKNVKGMKLPGPRTLPIVGNSLSIDFRRIHLSVNELGREYDNIFQLNIMGQIAVVINDSFLVKQAFGGAKYGDVLNDRPDFFFGKYVCFGCKDIAFAKTNKETMTKRKMFHRALKLYGDGVEHFERNAEEDLKRLLHDLENTKQSDFDFNEILRKSFANTTVSLMTGAPAKNGDSKLIWQFIDFSNTVLDIGMCFVLELIPFVRLLPGRFGNMFRKATDARDLLLDRFYFSLKNSPTSLDRDQPGMVRTLMRLQKEENQLISSELIDEDSMKGLVIDIIFGGTDTTTTALTNAFALLLVHHHCAERIHQEIDNAVGTMRKPKLSDRHNLPYTMATVYEVLRYTSAGLPLNGPHRALTDLVFEGYNIPKHSVIFANLWFIHHDPKTWTDPWMFKPERFLDLEGKLLPPEHGTWRNFLPFSTGHRDCPGHNLAKSRMFLYLATVLQSFDIIPGCSGVLPDIDPHSYIPGINLRVKNHMCRAIARVL